MIFESESIGAHWGHIPIPCEPKPINFERGYFQGYVKPVVIQPMISEEA